MNPSKRKQSVISQNGWKNFLYFIDIYLWINFNMSEYKCKYVFNEKFLVTFGTHRIDVSNCENWQIITCHFQFRSISIRLLLSVFGVQWWVVYELLSTKLLEMLASFPEATITGFKYTVHYKHNSLYLVSRPVLVRI